MPESSQRLDVVDALRGIASLSVAWFHITLGSSGWLKESGKFGWLGVEAFFVISGFVIPLALHRADYRVSYYGRFVLKRLLRLDPPYLASIVIIILLGYLSPYLPGAAAQEPFSLSPAQLLLHLGYVNVFFGYPWYNMVFWTLAIEFQYYLIVGLIFPIVRGERFIAKLITALVFCTGALFIQSQQFIFHYAFLFLMGIAAYRHHIGELSQAVLLALFVVFTVGNFLTVGKAAAIVGLACALVITFARVRVRPLIALGSISYSLYLLHVPIGFRVLNLCTRIFGAGLIASLCALLASIVAAIVFYFHVEKPAREWASKVNWKGARQEALIDQPAL
jgi:peptidoglycan/LPS O-acetylase OafA/YrhL